MSLADTDSIDALMRCSRKSPTTPIRLLEIENLHAVFDLYIWLGQRFPNEFPDCNVAIKCAKSCTDLVFLGLENISSSKNKINVFRKLKKKNAFKNKGRKTKLKKKW